MMKKNKWNQKPPRSGFTLVEVMIVLLILAMIAGMGISVVQGRLALANRRAAFSYVKTLENAVDGYISDVGYPPTTEQGLAALITCPADVPAGTWGGPYIKDTATSIDPWGNAYQYTCPGRNNKAFDVWSYGPDRTNGTDDDIGSWKGSLND